MPINRFKSNGSWGNIGFVYRLKNNGTWKRLQSVYRLKSNGTWNLVYSVASNVPVLSIAPTLTNQIASSTDFKNEDTLTLTRGTWENTGSLYDPVSYSLKIQYSDSASGPWTNASTGTGTSISYEIPIDQTRSPSKYFRGRVEVTNSSGTAEYNTTPVRSRINLSVTKPVVSTSPNVITVSWITIPTNSSLNIESQTLQIIANQQYTFNGNTYNIGDTVYSSSISPGTQTNVNISLSGTNITAPISYKAKVIVVAKDSAQTTVTSELSDAFTTNALTAPTPTDVTWTLIGGTKTWSIFFSGGSGPYYQATYALSPIEQTTTGFEASGSSSPILYTGLANPTDNTTYYWFVRSSNALDSSDSSNISAWSAASVSYTPRIPYNVSVSISPTSGVLGQQTFTATANAEGTPTPDIAYQWQFYDSEITQSWQNLGTSPASNLSTYTPQTNFPGTKLRCSIVATNLMGSTPAFSNEAILSAPSPFFPPSFPFFPPTFVPTYTLTVNCNGGTGCPASGTHTGSYTIPSTDPTRTDHSFNGYGVTCSGSNIGTYTAGQTILCEGNLVLTASWTSLLAAPVNTVAPSVTPSSGAPGTQFSCSQGTWTGYPTPTYSYQWQSFESGFGWFNISGATSNTFTPGAGYAGTNIKCIVTATNSQGSASQESNIAQVTAAPSPFFPPSFPFFPPSFPFFPPSFPFFPPTFGATWYCSTYSNGSCSTFTSSFDATGDDAGGAIQTRCSTSGYPTCPF